MIWLLYILLEAFVQWFFFIKKGITPLYWPVRLIRGLAAILYGAFVLDVGNDFYEILDWAGQVFLLTPFVFNNAMNLLMRKETGYVGEHSGFIEPFIFKHNLQKPYFLFTFVLFVFAIKYFV